MSTYLDCYPCLVGQALEAARMAGASEGEQEDILKRVLDVLGETPTTTEPPRIGHRVHRTVRERTGCEDPYQAAKKRSTEQALALYPWMLRMLDKADDRLEAAIRFAIAGNVIDARPGRQYDLREEMERACEEPLAIDDRDAMKAALSKASWVLYLADNAGETVCDRLLIETMERPVTYVVKDGPIANDATMIDARAAGLDQTAELMTSGSDAAGTLLDLCSAPFRRRYDEAPLIIAKGQANYKSLSGAGPRVFFLLQAKCPILVRDVGVPVRSFVLQQGEETESR